MKTETYQDAINVLEEARLDTLSPENIERWGKAHCELTANCINLSLNLLKEKIAKTN